MLKDLYIEEKRQDLNTILGALSGDHNLVDIATLCLQFIPEHRPTFTELLSHPFFSAHHDVKKEPTTNKRMKADTRYATMLSLRRALYSIVQEMNYEREMHYRSVTIFDRYGA